MTTRRSRTSPNGLQGPLDADSLSSRRVRRPRPGVFARVTLKQVADEFGISEQAARRLVTKHRWLGLAPYTHHGITTYDAKGLERLKAIRGLPNRASGDWLDKHLGEPHGQ